MFVIDNCTRINVTHAKLAYSLLLSNIKILYFPNEYWPKHIQNNKAWWTYFILRNQIFTIEYSNFNFEYYLSFHFL